MPLYFATHSTTVDNEANLASGWRNTPLSELGKKQALFMRKNFSELKIQFVCTSDLKGAVETAEIAVDGSVPRVFDKRLREFNYGDYDGKPAELLRNVQFKHITSPFPNGESMVQAIERAHEFYRILRTFHHNDSVLIIGHRSTYYALETFIDNTRTLRDILMTPFRWQPYWQYQW